MANTKFLNIGCTTQALYNQGPGALSNKLQATSFKLDMKDSIGYIINDGKSYTLYAGNDILFIQNLLPDTCNGSLMILRNSAAEALKLHHHKNPALGGPGCFRVMVFLFFLKATSSKLQAASRKPRAASIKLQAASCKLPNIFSFIKIRETRGEGLYQDKCVLRMLHVKGNLVW